jgi:LysR family glycine cleavage system transcriptional activator
VEEILGVQLFRRLNRRLMLTDAGQGYLPPLREALDGIAAATRRLRAHDQAGPLRVSVLNSFAAKWLLPRLSRFRDRHPEIDVVVAASDKLTDFGREDVDMGIRYGLGRYPDHLRTDLCCAIRSIRSVARAYWQVRTRCGSRRIFATIPCSMTGSRAPTTARTGGSG